MSYTDEQTLLEWPAEDFEYYEKGSGWYITLWSVAALLIGYEMIQKDYMAVLVFAITAVAIYFFSKQRPKILRHAITNKHISIGEVAIPFASIKKFWIVSHDQANAVHLETTAYLNNIVIVQLGGEDAHQVRDILAKFLPEGEPNRESVAHRISRKLRF